MSKIKILKFKSCRKFSADIWKSRKINLRQQQVLLKKAKKMTKKQSNYALQLQSRQLLSVLYGKLTASYLYKLFKKSYRFRGKVGNNFLSLLEKRLDVSLYRLNFVSSIAQSKQLINHRKIQVNNNVVNKPGFLLRPGDIISIVTDYQNRIQNDIRTFVAFQEEIGTLRPKLRNQKRSKKLMAKIFWHKPLHLEVSYKLLKAVFLFSPQQIHYPVPIDLDLLTRSYKK